MLVYVNNSCIFTPTKQTKRNMKTIGKVSQELEKRGYYTCITSDNNSGWFINLGGISDREFKSICAEYPTKRFKNN